MGTNLTSPLTTVLAADSPNSIFSTYKESASGCFEASRMRPTRRSRRPISTGPSSAGLLAGAADLAGFGLAGLSVLILLDSFAALVSVLVLLISRIKMIIKQINE